MPRESLLDELDGLATVEQGSDLDERCQAFHTEAERWEVLRDTYLIPVVLDAARQVEDGLHAREPAGETSSSIPPSVMPKQLTPPSELPPTWPWQPTTGDSGDEAEGLPPHQDVDGQCEHWRDIFQMSIALPSSYHPLITSHSSMRSLVELETDFRRAEALNQLEDVRTSIIAREVIKLHKQKFTGKSLTTRNRSFIQEAEEGVQKAANRYRRHWIALHVLGFNDTALRPLAGADLTRFDVTTERDLGKSKRQTSWIWENFSFVDSQEDDRSRGVYDDGMGTRLCNFIHSLTRVPSASSALVQIERAVYSLERRAGNFGGGNEAGGPLLHVLGAQVAGHCTLARCRGRRRRGSVREKVRPFPNMAM